MRSSTLVQWKNHLLVTTVRRGTALATPRKPATVAGWLVALVEFYRWAALEDLVLRDLVAQLTEDQVVRPGTRGGEHGRIRSVMARSLKVRAVQVEKAPLWLSEEADRRALLELPLRPRDRFLVN